MSYKILPEQLRIQVDKQEFGLNGQTTAILPPPKGIESVVGQDEAISTAIRGLDDKSPTTNIIITGDPGVGKSLLTGILLEDYCRKQPNDHLTDKVIVYNFKHEKQPIIAELPKATARGFAKSIDDAISQLIMDAVYIEQKYQNVEQLSYLKRTMEEKQVLLDLEKKYNIPKKPALDKNNQPRMDKKGQPIYGYEPKTPQECNNILAMLKELSEAKSKSKAASKKEMKSIEAKKKKDFGVCVEKAIKELKATYEQLPLIKEYLHDFGEKAADDFHLFCGVLNGMDTHYTDKYKVKVAVDHTYTVGIPFAKIEHPDERTLLGEIKAHSVSDESKPSHLCVEVGKMVECDGGLLLLDEKFTGLFGHGIGLEQRLLTILEERKAKVSGNQNYLLPTEQIETNEVNARTKIVACMNKPDYYLCQEYFPQLMERFGYKVHFQSRMENNEKHRKQVASFVATEIRAYNEKSNVQVPHYSEDGLVSLLEHMARHENQGWLTTRLRGMRLLVVNAAELARQDNNQCVERRHMLAAIKQQSKNSMLYSYEKNILEEFGIDGRKHLLTAGEKIGQINGLAYYGYDGENYAFGSASRYRFVIKPSDNGKGLRFTDIEKISGLTGPTHDKGVELLKSFYNNLTNELREKKMISGLPPGLEVDMSVPESWNGRDGPSATAAQTYAFLSELSGIPIKQSIAVTGAMGADGEVTIVGGLNEKIEGWYKILAKRGHLGKDAGVMIPAANVQDCNLSEDVIQAMQKGDFSVYYHKDIREGVEVIMGKKWEDVIAGIKNTFDCWETMHAEEEAKNILRKREIIASLKRQNHAKSP